MNMRENKIIKLINSNFTIGKLSLVLVILFMGLASQVSATHIVGGDISYKCLGSSQYEVTLTVRIDCENGEEYFDETAFVGVFDGFGNLLPWVGTGGMVQLTNPVIDTVDTNIGAGPCGFVGDEVCVEEAIYTGIVSLPFRTTGYFLAYQRCCRNFSVTNLVNPLETGATYFTRVTEKALLVCNDSPKFNEWSDIFICANEPHLFDHSASESDGDSLVYSICAAKNGATFDNPQPSPPDGPPYEDVIYQPPFGPDDPMGGVPLVIDPQTGIYTATPNALGQFQIAVCVEEYRDGELLSRTIRDFQYNVVACINEDAPIANFDAPDLLCDGTLTVDFVNQSQGAESYTWNFNYPTTDMDFISMEENPTFTFPGPGEYVIALSAIRDLDGCTDTKFDTIGLYDSDLLADFEFEISSCVPDSTNIQFTDTSVDPDYEIVEWDWVFMTEDGYNNTSNEQNPFVTVPKDDNVVVSLTVYSDNGCSDAIEKEVDADPLDLEVLASPAMICEGDTTAILIDPNCDVIYTILPQTYVWTNDEDTTDCNIYIIPFDTIEYRIYASNGICFDSTSLTVEIIPQSDLVLSGDSLACADSIHMNVTGGFDFNQYEWSFDPDFDPLVGDMSDSLDIVFPPNTDTVTVYVRVKDGTGCSDVYSKEVINKTVDIVYQMVDTICAGVEEEIFIENNGEDDIEITWEDNDIIVMTTDSSVIVYSEDAGTIDTINFVVSNEFGCTEEGQIIIYKEEQPELDMTSDLQCGSFEVCFSTSQDELEIFWDFGDPTTDADTSLLVDPCYEYPGPGEYIVTLSINEGACSTLEIKDTVIVPEIIELNVETQLFEICEGEKVVMEADVNVDAEIYWIINGDTVATGNMYMDTFFVNTTVTVVAEDDFGCTDEADIEIEVYLFDIMIDGPDVICENDTVTLTLTNNSEGDNFDYNWFPDANIISGDGTTEVTVTASEPTEFGVIVTNLDNNCLDSTFFLLDVSVIDGEIYADPIDPYQCTESEIGISNPDSDWTFVWNNGETGPVIVDTIMNDTTYTVTVTDENGCTEEYSILITPQIPNCDENDVFLPNAFSPNNDGVNDEFKVRSNYIKQIDFVIYNRWGEEIFRTNDKNVGWDGIYNGEELAPDVYTFALNVVCSNGVDYQKIGSVTLIR